MSWIICGEDKQGRPFSFEANSVKGSCRVALGALLEASNKSGGADILRARKTTARQPGLYKLLWDDGNQVHLAGFWIVFGHHYLEDGPFGPPDKTPPYVEDILESLTEEVWWKNYSVYPKRDKEWSPTIILEWPNDLANRCQLRPPGLPLPDTEFAQDEADDFGAEFWLERMEAEQNVGIKSVKNTKDAGKWSHLPVNRSLLMVVKGYMRYTRIRHEGSFMTVPAEAFGDRENTNTIAYPDWLDTIVETKSYEPSEESEHFLGQPLHMPDGRVSFPVSGWLTKNLQIWPMFPKEIVPASLANRDVGSKAIAQFKQAMSISLMVLTAIVCLSLIVKKATTPVLEDVVKPEEPMPQPALSLCSADHEKFMEEFRCQIRAYGMNEDTDRPFCGDKGSSLNARRPLSKDFADLQAVYCGIRDRKADAWVWGQDGEQWYNFGQLAAAKACFNVLGYPWQYQNKKTYVTRDGTEIIYPNPELFFGGNLGINQLSDLIRELDSACDEMKSRMENQLLGTMVATHIGISADIAQRGDGDDKRRKEEAYELRKLVSKNIEQSIAGTGKRCFEAGLEESPYRSNHFRDLCGGMRPKEFLGWQKLDRSTEAPPDTTDCEVIDSPLLPNRNLESCSVISRYERARFGTDTKHDEDSKPDKLWTCHIGLADKDLNSFRSENLKWDLKMPIPAQYNLSGAGVTYQLILDVGLQVLAEKGSNAESLGECWQVLAEKMSKYKPVHPLIAAVDPVGWPSEEQQLCGQVCAAHFKFQKTNANVTANWVTHFRDLDQCLMLQDPHGVAKNPTGRLDRLILPWNNVMVGRDEVWQDASFEQVCAFNLIAQNYMPAGYLVGGIAPPVWSGDTTKTSRIAGDLEGPAAKSAQNLSSYGGARSRTTCGYVAAQCFASLMVEVMGDDNNQPSEWQTEFTNAVTEISRQLPEDVAKKDPWCRQVKPYLGSGGILPEGQLDFPCAKGVNEAQQNAVTALDTLIAQIGAP